MSRFVFCVIVNMAAEDVVNPSVIDASDTVTQQPSCLACNKVIKDGSESSVQCAKCDEWCHVSCSMAKEIFETLAKINKSKRKLVKFGMVTFICQLCCPSLKETEKVSAETSTSNSATTAETVSTQTLSLANPTNKNPPTVTVSVNTKSVPTIDKPDVENEYLVGNLQLCYFYKKGKCLHGKSGKKIINGRECQYAHPPKCLKYCRFGRDRVNGCQGNCNLFHPTLCRNSVKFRKCFSPECTFAHLNGTERHDKDFRSGFHAQSRPGSYPIPHFTERFDGRNKSNAHFPFKERGREEFLYHNNDFPPLHHSQQYNASSQRRQMNDLGDHIQRREFTDPQRDLHSTFSNSNDEMKVMQQSLKKVEKCIDYLMCYIQKNNAPQSIHNLNTQQGQSQLPSHQFSNCEAKN